jgi:2-polyprenyl-3-methyl-5-hydroxy-6-metoxy-1,4-benzoquinol methylase
MQRTVTPELLDSDSGSARDVQASLADLRFANRWFGGVSTTRTLIERVLQHKRLRKLSMLDVAAATGDVANAAVTRLHEQGIELNVVLLERSASHLNGNLSAVIGDALALPFADESFDLVTCSLFLHHLEPNEIRQFVGEALRVSRIAVLINDLRRHPLHLALMYAALPLFSPLTRHDAPASVRRAYTPVELSEVLRGTRAGRVEISRHYLFRMGAIAWKGMP